jgi:hypothetical protein
MGEPSQGAVNGKSLTIKCLMRLGLWIPDISSRELSQPAMLHQLYAFSNNRQRRGRRALECSSCKQLRCFRSAGLEEAQSVHEQIKFKTGDLEIAFHSLHRSPATNTTGKALASGRQESFLGQRGASPSNRFRISFKLSEQRSETKTFIWKFFPPPLVSRWDQRCLHLLRFLPFQTIKFSLLRAKSGALASTFGCFSAPSAWD